MNACTCPEDHRAIPEGERVWVIEPTATLLKRNGRLIPGPGVYVFGAGCPVHGYTVIEKEDTCPQPPPC